jgi:hypothetical protein
MIGHVLRLFLTQKKNASATVRVLQEQGHFAQVRQQDLRLRVSHLQRKTVDKYKKLSSSPVEHSVLGSLHLPAPPPSSPSNSKPRVFSPMKTRKGKCSQCRNIRGRLALSNFKLRDEQRKHYQLVRVLRGQLQPIKRLNQTIKRRDKTIAELRKKIELLETGKQSLVKDVQNVEKKKFKEKLKSAKDDIKATKQTLLKEFKSARKDLSEQFEENLATALEEYDRNENSFTLDRSTHAFSWCVRWLVYTCIVCNVATGQIANLVRELCCILEIPVTDEALPSRSTIQQMALELGVWSDKEAAELLYASTNVALGFDATTQDGIHINVIYMTANGKCCVLSLEQLPGGTSHDYASHFQRAIVHLAEVYSLFHSIPVDLLWRECDLMYHV